MLASGVFFEDARNEPDTELEYLRRSEPDVTVALCDSIVVAITALDQCVLDDVDLIGLPLDAVAWRVGGIAEQTERGEVDMYETRSGVGLWVRDGAVCQVSVADWSLIPD